MYDLQNSLVRLFSATPRRYTDVLSDAEQLWRHNWLSSTKMGKKKKKLEWQHINDSGGFFSLFIHDDSGHDLGTAC